MNDQQRKHFEYGRLMLPGRQLAQEHYERTTGREQEWFGNWLIANGLITDPVTGNEALRPVRAACLWAAEEPERFERYVKLHPRVKTVRGLHTLWKTEQKGEDNDPSVYVYRMSGALSGELLEPKICKIGSAQKGASARIASQSKKAAVGYVPKIELVLKCQKPAILEKLLHERFKNRRAEVPGREWFKVTPEDVELAVQEMESDGKLWRDGDWVQIGRKPKPPVKKRKKWSKKKLAAHQVFKKVLPNVEMMSDDPSSHAMISEQTGLEPNEAKAGLQWLIKAGYLDKRGNGGLTPSAKFYEHWRKRNAEIE